MDLSTLAYDELLALVRLTESPRMFRDLGAEELDTLEQIYTEIEKRDELSGS